MEERLVLNDKLTPEHKKFYEKMGYSQIVKKNNEVCGIMKFIYTYAIVVGLDEVGYRVRYCYKSPIEAFAAYLDWIQDPEQKEPRGYIVRKP